MSSWKLAAAVLVVCASVAGANLLTNAGLEVGDLSSWSTFGDGWRYSNSGVDVHTAPGGAVNDAFVDAGVGYRGIYQELSVTPGHSYVFSAYGRTWNADESLAFIEIEWRDGAGKIGSWASDTISGNIPESSWSYLTTGAGGIEAPVGTLTAQFKGVVQVTSTITGDTAYHIFDDFDAHDTIPEPGVAALVLLGLAGIRLIRRRG